MDGATGQGLRTSGLASAGQLADVMTRLRKARPLAESPANVTHRLSRRAYGTGRTLLHQYAPGRSIGDSQVLRRPAPKQSRGHQRLFLPVQRKLRCHGKHALEASRTAGRPAQRNVRLISITVDSQRDTPDVFDAYARRYDARKGWYFLGGDQNNVAFVLKKLGVVCRLPRGAQHRLPGRQHEDGALEESLRRSRIRKKSSNRSMA